MIAWNMLNYYYLLLALNFGFNRHAMVNYSIKIRQFILSINNKPITKIPCLKKNIFTIKHRVLRKLKLFYFSKLIIKKE